MSRNIPSGRSVGNRPDGPWQDARVTTRDPVRTRRALLDAAARAIAEQGAAVSLEAVAREAGVSKGGLLHHFRSREALLAGVVAEWLARFDAVVERHLDPADTRPGRVARAYVRAHTADLGIDDRTWRHPALLATLLVTPGVLEQAAAADRRWRAALDADGLHPQRVELITRALDGLLYAQLLGAPAEPAELCGLLLALTGSTDPLVDP
jgi:AcrR family transcriptional regulator